MISIKPGVRLTGLKPEAAIGVTIAGSVFSEHSEDMTITSCTEGKHSRKSLHYVGQAFDLRIRDMSKEKIADILRDIKAALGPEFDALLQTDHIHVEYDPKGY